MPRPRRRRWIRQAPDFTYFKPVGRLASKLKDIILTIDEYEAVRLKDIENLEQNVAADKMGISQPTFQRLLSSARRKMAKAIVEGKAIKIEGGEYEMVRPRGGRFNLGAGRGRGRMGGPAAAGIGGYCMCPNPKCSYRVAHVAGQPCMQRKCPKCGMRMVRE